MKADVLALIDTYTTAMQWAAWISIASALFLTGFAVWVVALIVRRIFASLTRANRLIDGLNDAGVAAGYARLEDAIREESQQS
ncbi:hypothetical protein [Streptomyces sp. NPDC059916]|uniref:hypothetical protein n=1 Tax=Streptomyces sp. NPDC059916 TaxID=3347001 RepID=UPI0036ACC7EA